MASPDVDIEWWRPLFLSLVAGSATLVGGLIVFVLPNRPSHAAIASALGFAAGVMVSVSVFDLWLPLALESWVQACVSTACVALGWWLTAHISRIPLPEPEQIAALWYRSTLTTVPDRTALTDEEAALYHVADSDTRLLAGDDYDRPMRLRSWRLGFLLALVLAAHNLPEGLAVAVGTVKSHELGLTLCVAIFLHNIAEGVSIAVPLLAATGNRVLAVVVTALSGFAEPLGALVGLMLLRQFTSPATLGIGVNILLCAVAGVMISISKTELVPQAFTFAGARTVLPAMLAGALTMGLTMRLV